MEKWLGLEDAAKALIGSGERQVWVELRDYTIRARFDDGKIREEYPWAILAQGRNDYKTVEEATEAVEAWIHEYLWERELMHDDLFDCRPDEDFCNSGDLQEVVISGSCENAKTERAAEFDEEAFKNFAVRVGTYKDVAINENGKIRYVRVPVIK